MHYSSVINRTSASNFLLFIRSQSLVAKFCLTSSVGVQRVVLIGAKREVMDDLSSRKVELGAAADLNQPFLLA